MLLVAYLSATLVAHSAPGAAIPFWDRKSLCAYVYHKQVEGWSSAQLRALAETNGVPERVIRWAEKNC